MLLRKSLVQAVTKEAALPEARNVFQNTPDASYFEIDG